MKEREAIVGIGLISAENDERYTADDMVSWVKRDLDIMIFEDEVIELTFQTLMFNFFCLKLGKRKAWLQKSSLLYLY